MDQHRLANLALSDNGFLFDTMTGLTYTLNKTGTMILRSLIEGTATNEIARRVVNRFDVSPEVAARDMEQFMARLGDLGILEKGASQAYP